MTQIEQRRYLVKRVRAGVATANEERELADIFRRLYRPHRVTNYLYDADEMYAAYLFAAWNAVYRAKPNVGDPVMFCIRRGRGAMLDFYRSESRLRLVLVCQECSSEWPYDRPYIGKDCRHCGHTVLRSYERTVHSRLSLERASAHHGPVGPAGRQDEQDDSRNSITLTFLTEKNKETKTTWYKPEFFDFLVSVIEAEGKREAPHLDPIMLRIARSALENQVPFRDEAMLQYGKSSAWAVYAEGVIARFLADRTQSLATGQEAITQ